MRGRRAPIQQDETKTDKELHRFPIQGGPTTLFQLRTLVRITMRVGVLGGGLQGCCIALSLAKRGGKGHSIRQKRHAAQQGGRRERGQNTPRLYVCR